MAFTYRIDHGMNVITIAYSVPPWRHEPQITYDTLAGKTSTGPTYSNGLTTIRLVLDWGSWQPALGGALDSTYTALVQAEIAEIKSAGLKCVLDAAHNFTSSDPRRANLIGSGISSAQFRDYWSRVASLFVNDTTITAYDLWNEPNSGVNQTAYKDATNQAFAAIRAVDNTKAVWVEGPGNWTGAEAWGGFGTPWIMRPGTSTPATYEADGVVYSAHCYPTQGGSWGGNFTIAGHQSAFDAWGTRMDVFINWLKQYGQKGTIGETGWANELQTSTTEVDAQVARAVTIFDKCKTSGVILGIFGWEAQSIYNDEWNFGDHAAGNGPYPTAGGVDRIHRNMNAFKQRPSDSLTAITARPAPAPPTQTGAGNQSITLSWTTPATLLSDDTWTVYVNGIAVASNISNATRTYTYANSSLVNGSAVTVQLTYGKTGDVSALSTGVQMASVAAPTSVIRRPATTIVHSSNWITN